MHGEPDYPPDFTHFDYVNPDAPKGGTMAMAAIGSSTASIRISSRARRRPGMGLVFETLTLPSPNDEAFSEYGLIAESIDMPDGPLMGAFKLRPEARWHDGQPMTVDDVIFSFDILKAKGQPIYRAYYADVVKAERDGERRVKFSSTAGNRELPLILGPDADAAEALLGRHATSTGRRSSRRSAAAPTGSSAVDAGRCITYERVPDYWARRPAGRRGRNNFDAIRYDYYRDRTSRSRR